MFESNLMAPSPNIYLYCHDSIDVKIEEAPNLGGLIVGQHILIHQCNWLESQFLPDAGSSQVSPGEFNPK